VTRRSAGPPTHKTVTEVSAERGTGWKAGGYSGHAAFRSIDTPENMNRSQNPGQCIRLSHTIHEVLESLAQLLCS